MAINGKFAMPKIDLQGCFRGSGKHWTFESSKSIQSLTYMWPCWTALLEFNVQPSCFLFISSLPLSSTTTISFWHCHPRWVAQPLLPSSQVFTGSQARSNSSSTTTTMVTTATTRELSNLKCERELLTISTTADHHRKWEKTWPNHVPGAF